MQTQTIRPGYKASVLGPIPQDWEYVSLGKIGETYSGLSGKSKDDFGEGFPYIPYMNIFGNPIIKDGNFDFVKIKEGENQHKVENGDIFFTTSSETPEEVGISSTYSGNNNNLYLNSFCFGIRLKEKEKYSSVLLANFFRSNYGRKIMYKLAQGATRYNLSKQGLLNTEFGIPRIEEQRIIANILSTVDTAIEQNQNIIKKIEFRNKGLQQKLLTGKVRLKGFENTKLQFAPIKSFSKEISEKNKNNEDLIVLSCTKYDGLVPSLEYFGRKIYSDDLTTYKIVPKNCFAYATNHIEEGSIGYQSKYEKTLISPMYTVFKTNETMDDEYLFKLLKTHYYIHEYKKRMEGSIDRRGGLRWDEFSKIKVPVPSLEEQKAIDTVLHRTVKEVALYKLKVEKLKQIKKGLMQQLLTGKVRVNIK